MKAALFIAVVAAAIALAATQSLPDPRSCQGQGYWLPKGQCKAFVQYFQDNQDKYNADQGTFQTLVNNAPSPNSECCKQANYFVSSGCGCDQGTLDSAGQIGLTVQTIKGINRAVPLSQCGAKPPSQCSASS